MLKHISIAALLVLLIISSCKRQISKDKTLSRSGNTQAEKKDIFSPVSESEAKQFVDSRIKKGRKRSVSGLQAVALSKHINLVKVSAQSLDAMIKLHEAKLADVPVPLNVVPLREYFDQSCADKKIILGYTSDVKRIEIVKFYNDQMERLGWENVAYFDGRETLMIFKKPSKFCSVSVRVCSHLNGKQEHTKVVIFTQF